MFRILAGAGGDRVGQEIGGQWPPSPRVERVGLADAEDAAQVTAREIEELRGDQLDLVAALDPLAIDACLGSGCAEAPLAAGPIDPAAMFAKPAASIRLQCPLEPFGPDRRIWHRGRLIFPSNPDYTRAVQSHQAEGVLLWGQEEHPSILAKG